MTDVNELQEEFASIDELGKQEEVVPHNPEPQEPEDDLPEKYRGKSVKDIARMHQEAEKLIGRHSQEVSELRKLTDQILQQQLKAQEVDSPEVDFFEDPKTAVRKTLEESPEFKEVQAMRAEMKRQETVKTLNEKHGDWQDIAQSEDFAEWIKGSKARIDLYVKAEQFDVDAADELLTNFKLQKGVKSQSEDKRQQQLKSAGVETSGSGAGATRKIYRRADLIRLAKEDPKRYARMNDEIMRAYQEGRVK